MMAVIVVQGQKTTNITQQCKYIGLGCVGCHALVIGRDVIYVDPRTSGTNKL